MSWDGSGGPVGMNPRGDPCIEDRVPMDGIFRNVGEFGSVGMAGRDWCNDWLVELGVSLPDSGAEGETLDSGFDCDTAASRQHMI